MYSQRYSMQPDTIVKRTGGDSRYELYYIIEVNGLLEEKGLNFKVHLRDACGKQSCWIEPLGNCACEGRYEEMYQVVEEYFRSKGQKIEFDETKLNFFAV